MSEDEMAGVIIHQADGNEIAGIIVHEADGDELADTQLDSVVGAEKPPPDPK